MSQPPQDAVAVIRTKPRERVPFPRGFGTVVLAIVCTVLAFSVIVLLKGMSDSIHQREQLACQVQKLGGKPVVPGVTCPPTPKPSPQRSPSPKVMATPAPVVPTIMIVMPSPGSQNSPYIVYRTPAPRSSSQSSPRPSATHSPTAKPSPSPSCILPVPKPLPCPPGRGQ